MQELRPYQVEALDRLRAGWKLNPILVIPAGGGKTTVAAHLILSAVAKCHRVLFLAHRKELIEQARDRLAQHGVTAGIIMAGFKPDPLLPVQVASVQTIINRDRPPADLIVVDEAHHSRAITWQAFIAGYPDACRIGLTATPFRLDGKGLGSAGFGAIVAISSPEKLIADGYLMRPRVFVAPEPPDLADLPTVHGDYHRGQLAVRMDRPKLIGDVVENWHLQADGRRTIVFASSVEHSRHLVLAFDGVRAEHLDASTPKDERTAILDRFRAGETTVACNYGILTEGVDIPDAAVCVLARPTKSLALYLQMTGRILRPAAGKELPVLLDHAGCVDRHGLPTDECSYSLEDGVTKASSGITSIKVCQNCFAVVPSSCRICPECGVAFATAEREEPETEDAVLVEMDQADRPQRVYEALVKRASMNGYKIGWARWKFKDRFGEWPRFYRIERTHYRPIETMTVEGIARIFGEDLFRDTIGVPPWMATWRQLADFAAWVRKQGTSVDS